MNALDPMQAELVLRREGRLGIVVLNRPKALNALTLGMIRQMQAALDDFAADPAIEGVWLEGAGERGLCAGGDIRFIHESGRAGDGLAHAFWAEEYALNARIARFPKPYLALMDGIVMGGGVGVAAHGSHRIVTERTRLAMPEVGIGFFPDVGASWLLSRAPGESGTYAALTGEPLGAGDAIHLKLADALVPVAEAGALRAFLADAPADAYGEIIARYAQAPQQGPIAAHREVIDRAFAFDRVEDILAALDAEPGDFSRDTARVMRTRSPTGLKLALHLLRQGRRAASLEECLIREFRGATRIMDGHDFYEGVRAAVIDKDRNPRWQPADLSQVTDDAVASTFAPLPGGDPDLSGERP